MAPSRQHARYRRNGVAPLGSCQLTTSPRRTPVAWRLPATVATAVSTSPPPSRPRPSTTAVPVTEENVASSGARSQAPPGRR